MTPTQEQRSVAKALYHVRKAREHMQCAEAHLEDAERLYALSHSREITDQITKLHQRLS